MLDREAAHASVESTESLLVATKCILAELDKTSEGLGQVRCLYYMGSLDGQFIVLDLLYQILINLAQRAVEHLASLEHVKDSVRKDRLVMTHPVDIKNELACSQRRVHLKPKSLHVEGQSESLLLQTLLELKISDYRVLSFGLIFEWISHAALL